MSPHELLFACFAFALGAAIGSFLNVCIYRMPRELSVNSPTRSFCPHCKYQIPWHHNLPVISWLFLRGKCGNCGARIAFRYIGVELLTGALFLAVWLHSWPGQWILALPLWIFASLLIVATFIDFEHYIIPDEITWGGAAAGLVLSFAVPLLHGVKSPLEAAIWSLAGAAAGYLLLWGVVEGGKIAFGKKRIVLEKAEDFTWVRQGEDADFKVGEENQKWSDLFARPTDRLIVQGEWAEVRGERFENPKLEFHHDRLRIGEREWKLDHLDELKGSVQEVTIPREAMGFGDVKFMACIGAFLGWKAVLFTVVTASMLGALVGIVTIALGKREWSAKIPFGPYLSLGALVWVFFGPQLVDWYWSLTQPPI
jgi:leader peptidase (prepilin peptidase)/N-methyltransferase